jgi:hypothetical protein
MKVRLRIIKEAKAQAGNNYKTGRQKYRQVEPAGVGSLNKVGRTAKRRKGNQGRASRDKR